MAVLLDSGFLLASLNSSEAEHQVQQNIVALRPIRGEMFIEHATSKRFFLAPAGRNISRSPGTIGGNIALRWSASYRVSSTIYKHLAPLERKLIPLLRLKVEFTT